MTPGWYHRGMRRSFGLTLIIVMLFASGYFYYTARAICPVPIAYRIGELDPRFMLSNDEARLAIGEAESLWEDTTGQNLFTYDADADFTINFIYDERQATADKEQSYRAALDETERANASLGEEYAKLVKTYNELQLSYESDVASYEQRLAKFNATVADYNKTGGAPATVYDRLKDDENALARDRKKLDATQRELESLVQQINEVGERGNILVNSYNKTVATYNEAFGEPREFTEGTYHSDGRIDIYAFKDRAELKVVLAHELGHALSLDHVDGTKSVMYFLIGEQPENLVLSAADIAQFAAVCGQQNLWDTIGQRIGHIFK